MTTTQLQLRAMIEMLEDQLSSLKKIVRKEKFEVNNSYMADDDVKNIGYHTRQIESYSERVSKLSRSLQEDIYQNKTLQS